jgi:hypothetical protein
MHLAPAEANGMPSAIFWEEDTLTSASRSPPRTGASLASTSSATRYARLPAMPDGRVAVTFRGGASSRVRAWEASRGR